MASEVEAVIQRREDCTYTKCYCEENVWKLCQSVRDKSPQHLSSCFAIFLSNHRKAIPLWKQNASEDPNRYIMWDYHVILLYKDSTHSLIFDLDTRLDFPSGLYDYLKYSIGGEHMLLPDFHRLFRVIKGEDYLSHFASDRSHMLKKDGTWMAAPPSYPPITSSESTNNIDDFISMDPAVGWGEVLTLPQLIQKFAPDLTDLPSLL